MYVVTRYVTHPNKKSKNATSRPTASGDTTPPLGPPFVPPIRTPATTHDTPSSLHPYDNALHDLIASLTPRTEPDGATLHCVVVSELCLKIGRITIPPAVALASEGYAGLAPSGEKYDAMKNVHPHLEKIRALKAKGNLRSAQAFFRGAWKELKEEEKWWMDVLGGDVEERRRRNLDLVSGVQRGMEGAKYV